jgi:hypothetical protein
MIDHCGTTWSKEAGGHYLNVDGLFYKTGADPELIEAYDWPDPDNLGIYRGLKQQAEDLHHGTDYAVVLDLGIDTQDVLPFRTPAEVDEYVHFIIKTLGEGGGYVLLTVHNIQEQVPPENIVTMFEACLSYRA